MAITMQGNWTVRVKSKDAAFPQRFQISGSDSADGVYVGAVGAPAIPVTGARWTINIQNQPVGGAWQDSNQRITFPSVSGGLVRFDINSNDAGGDKDYNDLVLTCSMPFSAADYILYGHVETYAGPCIFNPCYPWYYLIDRADALEKVLKIPELRKVIEKLYPERIPIRIPPIPIPDPPPFQPIVIPSGTPGVSSGLEFRSRKLSADLPAADSQPAVKSGKAAKQVHTADSLEEMAVKQLQGTAHPITLDSAPLAAGLTLLDSSETLTVARFADKFHNLFACDSEDAPGLLLRFQEYDRTNAEKSGGAYTGTGSRQDLGVAVTDEMGNYIFHFRRSLADLFSEFSDIAPGESFVVQLRPDVIVQVLGTGLVVEYESAPYYNIPNLKRIDLCLPRERVHPTPGCGTGRVIQRIGDILVLHSALGGSPNTLDPDGRITSRNANAPAVDCAGWRGELRLSACFGKPEVVSYSVRYKRIGIDSDWQDVHESHSLDFLPHLVAGGTSVGPTQRNVHVDGGPLQNKPTYDNHEGDSNWLENDLKVVLHSGLYRPADQPGSVDFKIEGYDSAGNLVAGTVDTIRLYIHNRSYMAGRPNNSKGDIASITMGTTTLDECALFELTDPRAPLTVRYRAVDPEGFLHSWGLSVTRGNNHAVGVSVASGVAPKAYTAAANPCDFKGTRSETSADPDDYVMTALQPTGTDPWLPTGVTFCAFAFTLTAHDRVTDGRTAHPLVVVWQDLIGLSYTAP